jgi:hypothetical protein
MTDFDDHCAARRAEAEKLCADIPTTPPRLRWTDRLLHAATVLATQHHMRTVAATWRRSSNPTHHAVAAAIDRLAWLCATGDATDKHFEDLRALIAWVEERTP